MCPECEVLKALGLEFRDLALGAKLQKSKFTLISGMGLQSSDVRLIKTASQSHQTL